MKRKHEKRLIIVFVVCLVCSMIVVQANSDYRLKAQLADEQVVVMRTDVDEPAILTDTYMHALVLYGDETTDEKLLDNTETVMEHMRIDCDLLQMERCDSVDLNRYDLVVIASDQLEEKLNIPMNNILSWVEKGGKLFWGIIPSSLGPQFYSVYRKLGMLECSGYMQYEGMQFEKELIPGTGNESFTGESFVDVGFTVNLADSAVVSVTSQNDGKTVPVVWSNQVGEGRTVFYNGTSLKGDFWRGFLAGCINAHVSCDQCFLYIH